MYFQQNYAPPPYTANPPAQYQPGPAAPFYPQTPQLPVQGYGPPPPQGPYHYPLGTGSSVYHPPGQQPQGESATYYLEPPSEKYSHMSPSHMNHTSPLPPGPAAGPALGPTPTPPPQQSPPAPKDGKKRGFGKGMLGAAGGAVAGAVLAGSLYV